MLSVKEAQLKILSAFTSVDSELTPINWGAVEQVTLLQASGRVLAEDQMAMVDVPPWDNSAMDGYAFCADDLIQNNNSLNISQIIPAGVYPPPLQVGTAARIFTGAPVPEGADTIEMQENTEQKNNDAVQFLKHTKQGSNIRRRGQDIKKSSVVVDAGTRLNASHIGLLASVGLGLVPVYKPLRVAVVSTGDELAEPEIKKTELAEGKIYNSNRYLLSALIQDLNCELIDGGIIPDDLEKTKSHLLNLSKQADIIISTGGVSVGDEDHVKNALEAIGELNLWKIAIKPGKPLAFGEIYSKEENKEKDKGESACVFFGLPGNPVSAFVTFLLFVKPYLLAAQGGNDFFPKTIEVTAGFDWPQVKREEYLRGRLLNDETGLGRIVEIFPNQSSGALSSVAWANGLVVVPAGEKVSQGDRVKFIFI